MGIFSKSKKIPLTDRKGKIIYVREEDKDKYVLTNRGWLLKDKVYVELGRKLDPMKGKVWHIFKRTGWEIHRDEIELKKAMERQWEEFERNFMKEHDPEWLENFEREHGRFWYRN